MRRVVAAFGVHAFDVGVGRCQGQCVLWGGRSMGMVSGLVVCGVP